MREARRVAEIVIASIYVNPLQFGVNEDLAAYPRTPSEDEAGLRSAGVDLLFRPGDADVYPRGLDAMTRVEVPAIGDILCGASRPGHFGGVATVVNRLFNLVQPDVALFGKKDYQQLLVIRFMAGDLGIPVEILGLETVRDPDGLAMSSRNQYLSADERRKAPMLFATLNDIAVRVSRGETRSDRTSLESEAVRQLETAGFRPDYVSIRRQRDLGVPETGDRKLVILGAAWLGRARLIDNIEFEA